MKLEVWQKGIELFKIIWITVYVEYKINFKLRPQIANAAQSVSANISDGYIRHSINEYLQFFYISLASLSEMMSRIIGLKITEQITKEKFAELDQVHYEVENKLLRLVESLERKRDEGTWVNRIVDVVEEFQPE